MSIQSYTELLPNGLPIEMIFIKGSSFYMGNEDGDQNEKPIHEVQVSDFYMGKYPVTKGQYMQFVEATKEHLPEWLEEGNESNIFTGKDDHYKKIGDAVFWDNHPIVGVSWEDVIAFCDWLSELSGKNYRLPSEAEWEYAAKGGLFKSPFVFSGSNRMKEIGWFDLNSHEETKAIGLKKSNALGLHDMSGNVDEWCADLWHENYEGAPQDGLAWFGKGDKDKFVVRGGSWDLNDDGCRVSGRGWNYSNSRNNNTGFRVCYST